MARTSRKVGLTVASRTFFREMSRYQTLKKGFHMMMSAGSPDSLTNPETFKAQSRSGAPIVMLNDLTTRFKGDGATTVRAEMIQDVYGLSVVGDADSEGTEKQIGSSYFDITVEHHAKSLKSLGVMGKLRNNYNDLQLIRPALNNWAMTHMSERALFTMAGARGDFYSSGMNIPPANDARTMSQFENGIQAPTFDRAMYAGGKTSIDTLTATDVISLDTFDDLRYRMDSSDTPIRTLDMTDKAMQDSMPTHMVLLSPAQWKGLMDSNKTEINTLIAGSRARTSSWDHPVFKLANGFMYQEFWIMQNYLPIRFLSGSKVKVSADDNAATESDVVVPNNVTVDRALVLGGAALGMAFAASESGRGQVVFRKRKIGFRSEGTEVAYVNGCKKFRFADREGKLRDMGVGTIDSAVSL